MTPRNISFRQLTAQRTTTAALLALLCLAAATAGCGGGGGGNGGGGSNSGSSSGTNTPTRLHMTVSWQALGRVVNTRPGAQSVVVVLPGGSSTVSGGDLTWVINRDASRTDAYQDSYTSSEAALVSQYNAVVRMYSGPNGTGVVIGETNVSVNLSTGTDIVLPNNGVPTTLATFEAQPVRLALNGTQSVAAAFVAKNAQGVQISLPADAVQASVVEGNGVLSVDGTNLRAGSNPGLAKIVISAFGVSSSPITVAVGNAPVNLTTDGTRGAIALKLAGLSGGTTGSVVVSSTANLVGLDWLGTPTLTAPATYGDRQFVEWRSGSASLGGNPTVSLNPQQVAGSTPVTAVYGPRAGAGTFAPNFNKSGNLRWAQFPVSVYITAQGADHDKIRKGLDRWNLATGGAVSYTEVGDAASAQVTVGFGATPGGASGNCQASYEEGTNQLASATISILPSISTENGGNRVEAVAAHEFGHALGIISTNSNENAGHSDDANDLMNAMVRADMVFITERDINTLENLYPELFGGASRAVTRARHNGSVKTVSVF